MEQMSPDDQGSNSLTLPLVRDCSLLPPQPGNSFVTSAPAGLLRILAGVMFNRFAKTDEDLLREQADFLMNPFSGRFVNTVSSTSYSSRPVYNEQHPCIFRNPVSLQVIERRFSSTETISDSNEPIHRSGGQPCVPLLGESITDADLLHCASRLNSDVSPSRPKARSIFAKQLLAAKEGVAFRPEGSLTQPRGEIPKLSEPLRQLADTGPCVIRRQQDFAANEIVRIHENNINLLSQLSEEEILREREAIIESADPKVISFLMRKKAAGHEISSERGDKTCQSSENTEPSAQLDAKSILASLGIEPNPSVPHMDVVEPEKLAWMQDLPHSTKAPTEGVKSTKACNARFDLEGRVVPPDADIPTHLGLHHHGDEPERGGYTIGELFHLASSSQPVQRRIALSSLATALAASRRGHHAALLQTPSLLSSLLLTRPTGICFLLRWALDQCVSEATRASAAVSGGGISIALIGECFRALNNLLVDEKGEALLDEAFDWSSECRKSIVNLSPSTMTGRPYKFRLEVATSATVNDESDEKPDHLEKMAADPVGCLFAQTNLAARIGWMLSPGPALCLPPDTVAHTLPALLITAARHSTTLALLVYKTPHLIASLTEHFLPLEWNDLDTPQPHGGQLSTAYGVPLPRVLKLMRVLAQRSTNLRLMLVNDWRLVERCIAYLLRFPTALPPEFGVLLQLESLRCLSVCLEEPEPPSKAIELFGRALNVLVAAAQVVMESGKNEDCLRIAWLSFFANVVVPRFSQYLSTGHMQRIRDWAKGLSEEVTINDYEGGEGKKASLPALVAVTVHLLKVLGMEELGKIRKRVFQGPAWNRVLHNFIRHQSVLTGFPQRTSHVDVLATGVGLSHINNDPSTTTIATDIIFESGENEDLLSPITVSSTPPCLPDLGMSACLFYRGACTSSDGSSATLSAMWWPSIHSLYPRDIVEPLDLALPRPAMWPSFLPLVEAAIILGDVDLAPWCSRLTRLRVPPVVEKACSSGTPFPHGIMAIETAMMRRYLLARWSDSKEEELWWAAFYLLPYFFFGQEALLIELLQKVIFPIYDLTPIERDFSVEVMNALPPWPPVHESFPLGLAFHAHRVYVEYFTKLLQDLTPEAQEAYKALKIRPSCDFILPDDWFYMPLLEPYFWGCRQRNNGDESKIESTGCHQVDSEAYLVKAVACLGWIQRLLNQRPPLRRSPKPREISAGGHLARVCCAILAYQGAGALCFNASGAIIAELINLLAQKVDLTEIDRNPEAYLPLDLLSFYDLFIDLLEHYAAVSYSSPIFGNLLLLFLQSSVLPPTYRRALWGEHQAALRAFQLSPVEVVLPTAIYEGLFEPLEKDEGVLRAYISALCSGVVHPARQPLAALIALHHLNRNIYLVNAISTHGAFFRQFSAFLRFVGSCDVRCQAVGEETCTFVVYF
ncbi:RNA polymerase II-associated protein 1 [Taenia crassiceps]|uniref:RNA polymerase II-associated protein 1 n=1 Tax=Taenia crassiceps TaxID=6207 RepID=A0ABR4Q6B2_9CEST